MKRSALILAAAIAITLAGSARAVSLLPLSAVADESGFGTQIDSLNSPFSAAAFAGVVDSRVYVDDTPASVVTFVWDVQITQAIPDLGVHDYSIAATGLQNDLRIGEVISGVNGYVSSTTTKIPSAVDAFDNPFPTADELVYGWAPDELLTGDRAVLYVQTTGAVDVGALSAAIQNGQSAAAVVLGPVDDPENPDLNIPEPATIALLGGGLLMLRRRR